MVHLKALKNIIKEKKKKNIDTKKLEILAKEIEKVYKKVESEVGVKVDDLKAMWDPYSKGENTYIHCKE